VVCIVFFAQCVNSWFFVDWTVFSYIIKRGVVLLDPVVKAF